VSGVPAGVLSPAEISHVWPPPGISATNQAWRDQVAMFLQRETDLTHEAVRDGRRRYPSAERYPAQEVTRLTFVA
jgi:hypothetical protein